MSKYMMTPDEVAEIMECSKSSAYLIIRQLNTELAAKGFITRSARIPRKYFFERIGIEMSDD